MYLTYHCELVTFRVDPGDYTIYVFRDLDSEDSYIMCTKYPNWSSNPIAIGQIGYLKVKEVLAGKDNWYDNTTGKSIPYKYDGVQFFDFVLDKKNLKDEFIMV